MFERLNAQRLNRIFRRTSDRIGQFVYTRSSTEAHDDAPKLLNLHRFKVCMHKAIGEECVTDSTNEYLYQISNSEVVKVATPRLSAIGVYRTPGHCERAILSDFVVKKLALAQN